MVTQNFFNPTSFRFSIKRLKHVEYFVQGVSLPGMSMGTREQPNQFRPIYRAGNVIEYGELNLSIKLDSNIQSIIETVRWMEGLAFPKSFAQRKDLEDSEFGLYSDATLTLANNKGNAYMNINFKDIFPTNIGEVQLNLAETDIDGPIVDISFKHNGMEFNEI